MALNNKFIRVLLYFFASFGIVAITEISLQKEYSVLTFSRDLLVALFIAVNTVFITPVVLRFFQQMGQNS